MVYAGDENLTALTFGANIDSGVVGAEGAGVFRPETGGENALTAYYLQQDETGVLRPRRPFDTATLTGEHTFTGTDYPARSPSPPGPRRPPSPCPTWTGPRR